MSPPLLIILQEAQENLCGDLLFLRKDTRGLAGEWIHRHAQEDAVIVLDDPGQSPRLIASRPQLRSALSRLRKEDPLSGLKARRLEKRIRLEPYPSPSYNLHYLSENPAGDSFTLLGPFVPYDLEKLKAIRADYVLADGVSALRHAAFYAALNETAQRVAVFDPRRDARKAMGEKNWTYLPIDAAFWNRRRPGPVIYIYEMKKNG